MKMANVLDDDVWDEHRIMEIENRLLQGIIGCRTTEAVESAVTFATFLSTVGLTPENYPVFLRILEVENHWVIDALIGERDPFLLLSAVPWRSIASFGRVAALATVVALVANLLVLPALVELSSRAARKLGRRASPPAPGG